MRILVTGICGFAGASITRHLLERREGLAIAGIDNLMRPGSEIRRGDWKRMGVQFFHGDIRVASDIEGLPGADWVIDAAANPSVLAGVSGGGGSRRLCEHNILGVINILEYCKKHGAGLILLSSSRVYSIQALAALPLCVRDEAYQLDCSKPLPPGVSACGIDANFSTEPPISLYGSTKFAAEALSIEYGMAFSFPVWIDRCGVLAGAGQFGTPDQGIFSYWVNAHMRRRGLRYIGFDGSGHQVRDALHPRDLATLLDSQMSEARRGGRRLYIAGGGPSNAMSLAQLTAWCDSRFGLHAPAADPAPRQYDVPWIVMDSRDTSEEFGWCPTISITRILEDIARHAEQHPNWLEVSGI